MCLPDVMRNKVKQKEKRQVFVSLSFLGVQEADFQNPLDECVWVMYNNTYTVGADHETHQRRGHYEDNGFSV